MFDAIKIIMLTFTALKEIKEEGDSSLVIVEKDGEEASLYPMQEVVSGLQKQEECLKGQQKPFFLGKDFMKMCIKKGFHVACTITPSDPVSLLHATLKGEDIRCVMLSLNGVEKQLEFSVSKTEAFEMVEGGEMAVKPVSFHDFLLHPKQSVVNLRYYSTPLEETNVTGKNILFSFGFPFPKMDPREEGDCFSIDHCVTTLLPSPRLPQAKNGNKQFDFLIFYVICTLSKKECEPLKKYMSMAFDCILHCILSFLVHNEEAAASKKEKNKLVLSGIQLFHFVICGEHKDQVFSAFKNAVRVSHDAIQTARAALAFIGILGNEDQISFSASDGSPFRVCTLHEAEEISKQLKKLDGSQVKPSDLMTYATADKLCENLKLKQTLKQVEIIFFKEVGCLSVFVNSLFLSYHSILASTEGVTNTPISFSEFIEVSLKSFRGGLYDFMEARHKEPVCSETYHPFSKIEEVRTCSVCRTSFSKTISLVTFPFCLHCFQAEKTDKQKMDEECLKRKMVEANVTLAKKEAEWQKEREVFQNQLDLIKNEKVTKRKGEKDASAAKEESIKSINKMKMEIARLQQEKNAQEEASQKLASKIEIQSVREANLKKELQVATDGNAALRSEARDLKLVIEELQTSKTAIEKENNLFLVNQEVMCNELALCELEKKEKESDSSKEKHPLFTTEDMNKKMDQLFSQQSLMNGLLHNLKQELSEKQDGFSSGQQKLGNDIQLARGDVMQVLSEIRQLPSATLEGESSWS